MVLRRVLKCLKLMKEIQQKADDLHKDVSLEGMMTYLQLITNIEVMKVELQNWAEELNASK